MKEPHIYSPFSISNLTHNLKISINFVIDNKKNGDTAMKIYNTRQMAEIYQKTFDTGVTQEDLLVRVADNVSFEIIDKWKHPKPLIVFAGPGRKGAEALATAIILYDRGFKPEVYIVNRGGDQLCPEGVAFRDELKSHEDDGVKVIEYIKNIILPSIKKNHLIIDGLFGPELNGPIQGGLKDLVHIINNSGATIISIENPSGLPGDIDGTIINSATIKASLTLAVHGAFPTFFLDETAEVVGEVKVMDIGLLELDNEDDNAKFYYVEPEDISKSLIRRKNTASKADFGSGIIVTGQYGMMGASVLAAKGALRSGIGKLTIQSPRCGFNILQISAPEALFAPSRDDIIINDISLRTDYDAVAIGPGIGTNDRTIEALEAFLNKRQAPVILDADALNCIARRPRLLNFIPNHSILTPHKAEFDRLFGEQNSDRNRLLKAIEAAVKTRTIIVLKGHHTAVITYDGKVFFNPTGTPAMATAGSGDVLTGIITSFIAQGYNPIKACILAVFIHGAAGQMAEETYGSYGVNASDIAENTAKVIKNYLRNL